MLCWKKLSKGWQRLMEGHGFAALVTLCVAIITFTAVWTGRSTPTPVIPDLPVTDGHEASSLQQQSLRNAATPTPLPAVQPISWQAPLEEYDVLRAFAADVMTLSGVTGMWQLHAAVDISAEPGSPVAAMADGKVTACGEDELRGCYVELAHQDGYVTRYEGLALLNAIRQGDTVRAGQTLGFSGNTILDETDLGSHLHLQASLNGVPVDPLSLLE